MDRDLLDHAGGGHAFIGAAKIEGMLDAEFAHNADVGLAQMAQMVRTKNVPPSDAAAIGCRIAAEVAEIARTLEVVVAEGAVLHVRSLSQAVRQRNGVD